MQASKIILTNEHLSIVLAALRVYQIHITGQLADGGQAEAIVDIATNDGEYPLPTPDDVGEFAERLNTGYYDV